MYRILIADDEKLERNALRLILNKGIDSLLEIREVANGREAISQALSFLPDIVFLDIRMPGINGMEAAWAIREASPHCRIVFLSAYSQFEYAREAIKIGVDDYLVKPAPEHQVLTVVESLIKKLNRRQKEEVFRTNTEIKLNKITEYLENEFLYSLTHRGIPSEKFHNYLSIMDLRFHCGRACISRPLYKTYPLPIESEYQKRVLKKRCAYQFRKTLIEKGISCLYNPDMTNIYFLLISQDAATLPAIQQAEDWLQEISGEIRRQLDIEITISLGPLFHHPSGGPGSFSAAQKGLRPKMESSDSLIPLDMADELEQALINGDREQLDRGLRQLESWLLEPSRTGEQEQILRDMAAALAQEAVSQFGSAGLTSARFPEIRDQTETKKMRIFSHYIQSLFRQIEDLEEETGSPLIHKALQFIEENFHKDITLEETAACCNLSSFYFCKLFKKQKNMNFVDYLTKRRVSESKELLGRTNLSIKEIAYRIGYKDPNYFTRVFRKMENRSPSQYRNNKMLP